MKDTDAPTPGCTPMPATMQNVYIGEVKIGNDNDVLKATLGSCVGIAFIWRNKNIYGLAHCLLPYAPADYSTPTPSARYVSEAIPSLLRLMRIRPENYKEIEAVVSGGGNMICPPNTPKSQLVGCSNLEAAKKILSEVGIKVVHEETGGEVGRRLTLFCADGRWEIKEIPRYGGESTPS